MEFGQQRVAATASEWAQGAGWETKHLRLAIRAAGVALWSWNVDTDRLVLDEQAYALWGLSACVDVSFEDLSAHIHPSDRDRVRAAFAATRGLLGPYEIDFRIMVGDEVRWIRPEARVTTPTSWPG